MKPFELTQTTLHVGADQPFKMLHITDTHIARADERDDLRKQEWAKKRAAAFEGENPGCTVEYFRQSVQYANNHDALLVHTGDLFDFVSAKHCDMAHELLTWPKDYFMAVGNHEFSQYVGEAFEDAQYRAQSFAQVQAALSKYPLRFASRIHHGVNLIAIDNGYYDFTADQLDALKDEAKKGLPMLFFFHTPLYTPELYEDVMVNHHNSCAYSIGVPPEKMTMYDDYRFRQQITTPQTQRFLDYFYSLDLVKGVFAGHLHFSHESRLPNGVMQYVTSAQYYNAAREVQII